MDVRGVQLEPRAGDRELLDPGEGPVGVVLLAAEARLAGPHQFLRDGDRVVAVFEPGDVVVEEQHVP